MEIVNFYQEFSLILSAMPIVMGEENGHIFVKLKKEETELVLSVTDDGIGIAEEEQERSSGGFIRLMYREEAREVDLGLPWFMKL